MKFIIIYVIVIYGFSSTEGDKCVTAGYTWNNDHVLDILVHVTSYEACFDLCVATVDCTAFSWFDEDYGDHNFAETCKLFSATSAQSTTCSNCISGRIYNCKPCSEPVACEIDENLISDIHTDTEFACKESCKDTPGCGYYSWFDESTFLKNRCYLLSTCGKTQGGNGVFSGPPNCVHENCNGFEYFELDDPTRNENHGYENFCDDSTSPAFGSTSPEWKGAGWYRLIGAAGTRIPEHSPGTFHCGTSAPGWMRGVHPATPGDQAETTICFDWDNNDCHWSAVVTVLNCGDHFLYNLPEAPYCRLRYCGSP